MSRLTNSVVNKFLVLLADNKISDYQAALSLFIAGRSNQDRREELLSFRKAMRGVWEGDTGRILTQTEGKSILQNITDQLADFLGENRLFSFSMVVFKEMINWADTGQAPSLSSAARSKARQLEIDIGPTIDYPL